MEKKDLESNMMEKARQIAEQVANRAEETARKVAETASVTANKVDLINQTLTYIQKDVAEINDKLDSKYVTKEEFSTVRAVVYGLVSIILIAVIGGLMTILLK